MEPIPVLLTGDFAAPEFVAARRRMSSEPRFRETPIENAAAALEESPAALVVVAKSFPDQFPAAQIEALRLAAPLARLITIEGSWCESEGRTGRPWPGVARVAWWAAEAALHRELHALAHSLPSRWGGPATAAPFEAALWEADLPLTRGAGRVLLEVASVEQRSWLAKAVRECGYEAITPDQIDGGCTAAIQQITPREASDPAWYDRFAVACLVRGAPTLVVLDFPRRQDVERATSAGASGVLGLPCSLLDLSTALALAIERGYSPPDLRRSVNAM